MKVKTLPHPQSTVFVMARLSYLKGIIISVLGRELRVLPKLGSRSTPSKSSVPAREKPQ